MKNKAVTVALKEEKGETPAMRKAELTEAKIPKDKPGFLTKRKTTKGGK